MTDKQTIETQVSTAPETLSPELQLIVQRIQDKKTAWITAHEKESKAASLVDTLRQRHQQALTEYEQMKNSRSAMLFDSNGELTPEVKRLRAEMVEQRETADDLEELIALREKELVTLPWQTGEMAGSYITEHQNTVEKHINALVDTHLSEQSDVLFNLLAIKYKNLRKTNGYFAPGVVFSVTDANTLFKNFIINTFYDQVIRMDDTSIDDTFISIVGLRPEYQAVQDAEKRLTPAQRCKYEKAALEQINKPSTLDEANLTDELSLRADNLFSL